MRAPKAYDGPITVDVEVVTPELAAEWLTTNDRNRKLNRNRVDKYVDFIKRNQWSDAVADIAFDSSGLLQNGQHTLTACVKAEQSIVCTIKRGMPVDGQMITDTGRTRALSDQLQIEGLSNTNTIASAVRQFPVWIKTGVPVSGRDHAQRNATTGADNGASNDINLLAYCLANRDFLNEHASVAKSRSRATPLLTQGNLMVMAIVFNHFAGEYGDEFMAQLCNEVDGCAQPIRKYQTALLAQVGATSKWPLHFRYTFGVKALNAFIARREIGQFRFKANEAFPTINVPEGATV
jgi:hypothetical protein